MTGLPPSTVYELVAGGRIPAKRLSRTVRARIVIPAASIENFIEDLPDDWGGHGSYTFPERFGPG